MSMTYMNDVQSVFTLLKTREYLMIRNLILITILSHIFWTNVDLW
jgi:hypothetical protein